MSLKAVFLDVGGTLLHEEPPRAEIYARCARARGSPVGTEEVAGIMYRAHQSLPLRVGGAFRYSRPWFRAYMARVFHEELGLAAEALPGIEEELFARFADPATFRLYPGALELLEGLRAAGLRLGVVSNWGECLAGLLEGLGVGERVDFVLASAAEGLEKPDPALFRRALALAWAAPQDALHAGDHPDRDVRGARAAGLEGVLVDHDGSAGAGDLPRVTSLPELLEWTLNR